MTWQPMMDWYCTMLVMNAALCVASTLLYRNAPCWQQRVALALLIVGTAILLSAYALMALGIREIPFIGGRTWYVLNLGYFTVWLGVVMYVFRLVFQGGIDRGANRTVHP